MKNLTVVLLPNVTEESINTLQSMGQTESVKGPWAKPFSESLGIDIIDS